MLLFECIRVHSDRKHIHTHIIFNNTNLYNGLSFTYERNQGKKNERAWAELRQISDELCKENGLSVISQPEKGQGVSYYEYAHQKVGTSWKEKFRAKIAEVALYSRDFQDFLQKCTEFGIEYVYNPQNKVKLKFRLSGEGQQKFTRADTLGADFTAERIAEQITEIQKAKANTERLVEKKKSEKPVVPSIPIITPTQSTTPKTDYVYKPPTDEEFFNAFGIHLDELDEPTPTESKSPEKKEDVWAAIRSMRDSDKIIADLESGGITSLTDLRSFFWNVNHDDDHTDELATLDKKIKCVDKLIKMMKQRSKHSAVYKEYQECSSFSQKRFRKKKAAAIDSYEQADKYIKEHIKAYYVDGKAPKRSELEQMLIDLKNEYNALVPEHNKFLKRQAVAALYKKSVRTYLEKQHQQERDRQYQERKRTQQRKKDTLE